MFTRIPLFLCLSAIAWSSSHAAEARYGDIDEQTLESLKKQLPHIHQNIEYPGINDDFEKMEMMLIQMLIDKYEKGTVKNASDPNHQLIEYIFYNYETPLYYSQFENGFTCIHYGRRLLRNLFYLKAYAYEYKILYEKIKDKNPYPEIPGLELWLEEPKDFKKNYLFMLWDEQKYHLPHGYFPKSAKIKIASNVNNMTLHEQDKRMMNIKIGVNSFSPGYNSIFLKQFEAVRKYAEQEENIAQNN